MWLKIFLHHLYKQGIKKIFLKNPNLPESSVALLVTPVFSFGSSINYLAVINHILRDCIVLNYTSSRLPLKF